MKKIAIFLALTILCLNAPVGRPLAALSAETTFVTIGSGDVSGVYYPTGLLLAERINERREELGIRATVESTRGSVFNVNAIMAGYLDFALVQSDIQYEAFRGLAEWASAGPQAELRSIASLHDESVCLVAAVDSGIHTMSDLKGKRVNLGNPGSGQHRNAIDALLSAGIDPGRDIVVTEVRAAEAPALLADDRIDAFFCTVGHPSETLAEAVSGPRKVRFIPIAGPGIDRLIAERGYYTKTVLPVTKFYRGSENGADVETFGVRATLCTSARVPDQVVYAVTKALFGDLDQFRRQVSAQAGLTRERMLEGLSAPLHPGAMKYLGETGPIR